jgi:RNA polymerase sigma-70 factor (ECF subfamily)
MQSTLPKTRDSSSPSVELPAPSDEGLMAALGSQDAKALAILFERYSKLVFSIAFRILQDVGEAEEIVQECFFYLYQKVGLFQPAKGTAKVWIVQIAYSHARDRKEQLARKGFYCRTDFESLGLDDRLAGGDMERQVTAKLDFDRLQYAFEDLTDMQRQTLKLFYFEAMELREISEWLHEPLGNVRHHFYRGIERLRKSAVSKSCRKNRNVNNLN